MARPPTDSIPLGDARQWYLEDFVVSERVRTMARTVTETDLVNYLGVSGFFEEVFLNAKLAVGDSVFGRRVVPGVLVLAMAEGLFSLTGRLNRGLAFLGISDLQIKSPTAVGDTISVELEVKSTRLTKEPGRGILEVAHSVLVDAERVTMEYLSARMIEARGR